MSGPDDTVPPHDRETLPELASANDTERPPPPPPSFGRVELPTPMEAPIPRALRKPPSRRHWTPSPRRSFESKR